MPLSEDSALRVGSCISTGCLDKKHIMIIMKLVSGLHIEPTKFISLSLAPPAVASWCPWP